jgi:hypothetical protein
MNQLVEQTSSTDDRMDPLVVEILERVTVGDFGRMSERVSERAMRAWSRLIARPYGNYAKADARYVQLALTVSGLWTDE